LFTVSADEPVHQVGHFGSHVTEVIGTDQPDVRDTPGRGEMQALRVAREADALMECEGDVIGVGRGSRVPHSVDGDIEEIRARRIKRDTRLSEA
jgi:hypothetical protein